MSYTADMAIEYERRLAAAEARVADLEAMKARVAALVRQYDSLDGWGHALVNLRDLRALDGGEETR